VNQAFESWQPDGPPFDAVVAFTAFHWIDPDARYERSARLVGPGGTLAIVATRHVDAAGGDTFWRAVQEDYDAILPSDDNRPPPHPDEVGDLSDEIDASGLFRTVAVRRHLWDVDYDADEYLDVLDTYSGHRALSRAAREQLYERIRSRIESRPDRRVRKTYLATLHIARCL
jgi:SAM-dependent methyltransferase